MPRLCDELLVSRSQTGPQCWRLTQEKDLEVGRQVDVLKGGIEYVAPVMQLVDEVPVCG